MKNLAKIFLAFLILLFLAFSLPAYPPGWSEDILLTPGTTEYREMPDIAVDHNNCVWIVWDSLASYYPRSRVCYSKLDSMGTIMIPERRLSDSLHICFGNAKVAVDNNGYILIQHHQYTPTGVGIGYAKFDTGGSAIIPPKLAFTIYGSLYSRNTQIAVDNFGNMHIAMNDGYGFSRISYAKLDSIGNLVPRIIRVSPLNTSALYQGIGVDGLGNSHIAYRIDSIWQDDLAYSKIDKDGNILISNKLLGYGSLPTIIADRSQNIHMVYCDPTGPGISIKYLKLDQDGNFLISPKNISIYENNSYPHMAMDSLQFLHVVWNLVDPMGVMYTKLDTLGNYIISPIAVVDTPGAVWPGSARIAVDRTNRLHLVWDDQRLGSVDIYYKRGENESGMKEISSPKTLNQNRITVSPNPFTVATTVSLANACKEKVTNLAIYDASGRLVKSVTLEINTCQLGADLVPGIYFIKLNGTPVGKVVKVR